MTSQWLLFFHLVGAFLFVGGGLLAAALRLGAMRLERPSEIALLLRAVRPAVPVVAGGLVLTVVAGVWLADRAGFDLGATWLAITYGLVAWTTVVGAVAGRQDRHTRELAERLADRDDPASDELRRRLHDPVNLALDASMLVATFAIVGLMVWKPGG